MAMTDICFIDLETTGLDPARHEIIEIGAVRVSGDLSTELGHAVIAVLPERPELADPEALRITGRGPPWHGVTLEVALVQVRPLLDGALLAGHNIGFDLRFLEHAWRECCLDAPRRKYAIDTASMAVPLLATGRIADLRLATLRDYLGLSQDGAHTALADARHALEVARRLAAAAETIQCSRCGERCHDYRQSGEERLCICCLWDDATAARDEARAEVERLQREADDIDRTLEMAEIPYCDQEGDEADYTRSDRVDMLHDDREAGVGLLEIAKEEAKAMRAEVERLREEMREEIARTLMETASQRCARTHIQACSSCERLDCHDNTSPAKAEVERLQTALREVLPLAESRAEDLDEQGSGVAANSAVERARAVIGLDVCPWCHKGAGDCCGARHGSGAVCTRPIGHDDDHVACASRDDAPDCCDVLARWSSSAVEVSR